MPKMKLFVLVWAIGFSTTVRAQMPPPADVPREVNMAPDVVPPPVPPAAASRNDKENPFEILPPAKPTVKPAADPFKALLNSLRKTDQKRAAAEEERNNLWQEKTKIEADLAGLVADKSNLATQLKQETMRANKAEQQLAEKDKQLGAAIGQYQHFSGAIKNLFGLVIVGLLLMVVGMLILFGKLVGNARAQATDQEDVMARLPHQTNEELRKRVAELLSQLREQATKLDEKARLAVQQETELGDLRREIDTLKERHKGQMERLGRTRHTAVVLYESTKTELDTANVRVKELMHLLVSSLEALRDAAKDLTDMSCPHSLGAIITTLAAIVEPQPKNNLELPFTGNGVGSTKPS